MKIMVIKFSKVTSMGRLYSQVDIIEEKTIDFLKEI